jgi:putative flippase GtrA
MTILSPRISDALWRIVPGPLREKLRSNVVKRFVRFAPAAVCAVAATQITYIICIGPANLTAGISGALGWFAGAVVSYVISRWAWERKGRPNVLKETIPFAVVSICAGIILTLASKTGSAVAASMGLHHGVGKVVVADAFYFAANCLTFALRFLLFHFVLFRDRSAGEALAVVEGREPLLAESAGIEVPGPDVPPGRAAQPDPARVGWAMGSAPGNGAATWGNGNGNGSAGRMPPREAGLDGRAAPDPGRRR